MSLSGGMLAGYIVSKGDPFWTFSMGLCGIISASAGNDLYHPIQALLIGAIVPTICYKLHYFVERRFKIDDAVGAVAVHGYGGFFGVVVAGFMLWGQPSSPYEGFAHINPLGNFAGAVLMFALGFAPTFVVCKILNSMNLLRVPAKVELEGVDFALNQAFEVSVREVGSAEKAMIK
jgi:Amt family ammonium transporter